ncbi:MAG: tRNA (N6-isopentenyl adenosine(37)-C2)-methylthiotransferase MiaB [Clostridiales bacterium]|nr:tRNA (N6-isopentenyl adenosine(37)-C2)-methylthiotransferase MiaB [Clostridiales bacterium]
MERTNIVHVPKKAIQDVQETARHIKEQYGAGKKYFVESYGCQMNDHDSERLRGMLDIMGYTPSENKFEADFIIFNTCCVREHAEKRVFGNIGALKKIKDERPNLIIGVCGCMMQQKAVSDRLFKRFPFVDLVFGTNELHEFPQMFEKVLSGVRVKKVQESDGEIPEGLPATRINTLSTSLVVMYGCNNFCSYCIVPYVRGRERSRNISDIIDEAMHLADKGYKEITLLGQNVNSFKSDDGHDFADVLHAMNDIEGIRRIRFMTSHPKDLSDKLIDAMAGLEKVCNHIHLPVQSGSDRVLKLMNRKYDSAHYMHLIDELRKNVEGIEITTDIIVGFPTETEEDFEATLDIVRQAEFSAAFTFKYSPRTGTAAARMDEQVPEIVKKERLHRLNSCCTEIITTNNQKHIGTIGEVFVEGVDMRDKPMAFGKLSNFKMVYFPGDKDLIGQFLNVKITKTKHNSLFGELL